MKKSFKLSFRQIWLAVGIFSLLLPVFLPSVASSNFSQNVIGIANITMFVLSFPGSLFGLPVVFFAWYVLGMNPNSTEGGNLNTILFFILGLVQWFWLIRFWSPTEPMIQTLDLFGGKSEMRTAEADFMNDVRSCDPEGRTPLERVFREKDSE